MKIIKASKIIKLKLQGLSFKQISRVLGIPQGTAYRLYKRGLSDKSYFERIGNKTRRNSRPFCPLWEKDLKWIEILYVKLPLYLSHFIPPDSLEFQRIYDYFLDFAYTTPQILSASNPIAYFWGCVRKRICGVFINDIKKKEVRLECLKCAGRGRPL
ncbi:MAG TPA: sigma-70 family RNA polymerase sigma factor [Candidatus Desulfofervidus auxilii]|uniref:Sigma-70 family RNA polymerase sigma factor n=1 Tax=Desulfofervidus auxilii TaxID=1621989 RepID=A0A7C0YB87_DESA2|nr:sigma-70 family RNA polymerase sigma factor [Candidatus Desulfofervidus auxilii]